MTNLEKFEEVFGITIDDRFLSPARRQCKFLDFIDSSKDKCENFTTCWDCPLYKFWNKEYVEKTKPIANEQPEDFWW